MSDLPSSSNGQPARQRRNARRRAGVGASSHKKSALAQAQSDQTLERVSRSPAPAKVAPPAEREEQAAPSSENAALPEAAAPARATEQGGAPWRRLTPLSKQILLWGGITGVVTFLLSLGVNLLLLQLAPDERTATQNQTAIQTSICLNDLLWIGLLAFSGWRATRKMGMPRHGGMTGAWSAVVALLLGLLVSFVLSATGASQAGASGQGSLGQDILNTLSSAVFNIGIGFGAGWVGGKYAEWKRNKAQKQQEAAVAP